jgi:hypothetical protein
MPVTTTIETAQGNVALVDAMQLLEMHCRNHNMVHVNCTLLGAASKACLGQRCRLINGWLHLF